MTLWHVCVPGPDFEPSAIPDGGKVICVNIAIKGARRCDYWGAWDSPNIVHMNGMDSFRKLLPDLITDKSRIAPWQKMWTEQKLGRTFWPSIHTPKYGPLWFRYAAKSPMYTFFAVMGFAIQEGATHINILGCSLAGRTYFDPITSNLPRVKAKPSRVWNARWTKERKMLSQVVEAGKLHGVSFSGAEGLS